MSTKYHQMSLNEVFSDCRELFLDSSPTFFQLIEEHIDLDEFIPSAFRSDFYQSLGRNRVYPIYGFLSALILQKILSIPSDALLITLAESLQRVTGFLRALQSPGRALVYKVQTNFRTPP